MEHCNGNVTIIVMFQITCYIVYLYYYIYKFLFSMYVLYVILKYKLMRIYYKLGLVLICMRTISDIVYKLERNNFSNNNLDNFNNECPGST